MDIDGKIKPFLRTFHLLSACARWRASIMIPRPLHHSSPLIHLILGKYDLHKQEDKDIRQKAGK